MPNLIRERLANPIVQFLVSLLFSIPSLVHAQPSGLEAFVDSLADEYVGSRLVGLSVGITRGENILLKKSYGYANLEWKVPMPVDAVHEIGSITKQFTSVAILQLVEQNLVSLDADISEYLPDFDPQGRKIPLHRLMDHTSGMADVTSIPEFQELNIQPGNREEVFRILERHPFVFEPGYAQIYNDSPYMLLGHIIERVSGQSYEDYLAEHVFPLAGLKKTSYCSNSVIVEEKATGYQFGPDGFTKAPYLDHTWPFSAGSLCSTVSDLISWNQALHHGKVLSQSSYTALITPGTTIDGWQLRTAKGVVNYMHPTGKVIDRGGGMPGYTSFTRYYPEDDVTIVFVSNTSGMRAGLGDQIGNYLFGTRFELESKPYAGDLSSLVGEYVGPGRRAEMTVAVTNQNGELQVTRSENGNSMETSALGFLEGSTFFTGTTLFIFDFANDTETPTLRINDGGAHYVLGKR